MEFIDKVIAEASGARVARLHILLARARILRGETEKGMQIAEAAFVDLRENNVAPEDVVSYLAQVAQSLKKRNEFELSERICRRALSESEIAVPQAKPILLAKACEIFALRLQDTELSENDRIELQAMAERLQEELAAVGENPLATDHLKKRSSHELANSLAEIYKLLGDPQWETWQQRASESKMESSGANE